MTDADDIADIPNSEETINQLHFQPCKTNNLSEIDLNRLSQNLTSINISKENSMSISDNTHVMMENPYPIKQWKNSSITANDLLIHQRQEYNKHGLYDQINFINPNQPYSGHKYNFIPKNPGHPNYNPYFNYYLNNKVQQESSQKGMYQPQSHHMNEIYPQQVPATHYIPQPMNPITSFFSESAFTYNAEPYEPKVKRKLKERLDQTLFTINIDQLLQGTDIRTTIMIRHIPNKYSAQTLLDEIEVACKHKYDFFYLPIDAENQCNLGYSFINFLNPLHIIYFFRSFKARKWNHYKSHKECDLTFAKFQGKVELTAHLEKNSHKIDPNKKPMLFSLPSPLPKIDLPIEHENYIKDNRPELLSQINFK